MYLYNFNLLYDLKTVSTGSVVQYNNSVFIALKNMHDPQHPEYGEWMPDFIPWPEPGTDPTAWQEVPKDCDNCYCKAMTVKTSGSTPDEEVTSCPYAAAHESATQQAIPDVCQAWDPIVWPQLPDPQVQRMSAPVQQEREALINRLKSGRVCRAELANILCKLI